MGRKIITGMKYQFVFSRAEIFISQQWLVTAAIIIGANGREQNAVVFKPVKLDRDTCSRAAGGRVQYMCGQISHFPILQQSADIKYEYIRELVIFFV